MTGRKQLSMVLPAALLAAIKQRASSRGQSITAYITGLVEQDLVSAQADADDQNAPGLLKQLQQLEQRVTKLEQRDAQNGLQGM